ncbi:MAG: type I methionyl aminopeptidase [Candidatus Omnitrophica bacterium]|nr:type I methionyl aminopeptidase [Candidatus Omnitrophota bacterium]MDD5574293.1 type I methionyl aminopeptidase [Candidatus Omnitrophota bacterium]
MIPIKTCHDIDKMRKGGRVLAKIMAELSGMVSPGLTTAELDCKTEGLIRSFGVRSAFQGYRGYPAHICVSVNEEVVHGIPGPRRLREGDIVSIDIGIENSGYFLDMAETFPVGRIDTKRRKLIETAKAALEEAIKVFRVGNRLLDISRSVQAYVEARGFSVVRDFVGHGIGRELHEEPQIPNYVTKEDSPVLQAGMVFAIEPMINAGTWEVKVLQDGWTAVTKDKEPSAHFEHTVALTKEGPVVLTREE